MLNLSVYRSEADLKMFLHLFFIHQIQKYRLAKSITRLIFFSKSDWKCLLNLVCILENVCPVMAHLASAPNCISSVRNAKYKYIRKVSDMSWNPGSFLFYSVMLRCTGVLITASASRSRRLVDIMAPVPFIYVAPCGEHFEPSK